MLDKPRDIRTAEIGEIIRAIHVKPFPSNTVAPPLKLGKSYFLNNKYTDIQGNVHFDVGLESKFEFVTSLETGEILPRSFEIHWCHPSRFEFA